MSAEGWKARLAASIPEALRREIDDFELQVELRKQGRLDEKVFAEIRLRRGAYGQRYDNGRRHDGVKTRSLRFPSGEVTKGPTTLWDAPGMQRIKIPFGEFSAAQLETLAEVSEEYSDGILHVTTRQDFQLHFVHIEDTPTIMRRLAAAGITTREACGNTVRNVTACPIAGVCRDEPFDVTPYAQACANFLLGHPDAQEFGRKFKVAFSGCSDHACGLVNFHDLGYVARLREGRRGFEFWVGGGLGSVPYPAQLFDPFLSEEEMLPMAQAVCRVFARLGEKKNRARARLKFLVDRLGLEEFRRLVQEERRALAGDARWTDYLRADGGPGMTPSPRQAGPGAASKANGAASDLRFQAWASTNVYRQRQAGFSTVTVTLPLGDLTASQARLLADLARRFGEGSLRNTAEQNVVLRWVPDARLGELHRELASVGLGEPGAGTISDVAACPGTDTCKLGIASSRGLAGELRQRLGQAGGSERVRRLHIKASGCFNSCGQHHVADLGFYGVSRKSGNRTVPHFQVMLGGRWDRNAGAYGLAVAAVPSRRIPEVVERLTSTYDREAKEGEGFSDWVARIGKSRARSLLEDLLPVNDDPALFRDWGDPREFTVGDMGTGECAGEVVSRLDFGLAAAERQAFEAQLLLEKGEHTAAVKIAYASMLEAAKALLSSQLAEVASDPQTIVDLFRQKLVETGLFLDPFAGQKFAQYFFAAHLERESGAPGSPQAARQRVEEAQLFIEATHACNARMLDAGS